MQGDIVKAAKWFGLSIVVSTLIFVIGLGVIVNKNTRQLGSDLRTAGSNAKPWNISIPNNLTLRHSTSGPIQLDLAPNNKAIQLAPLKIELETPEPTLQEKRP
ncbi:MAG: hypothetical protein IH624_15925 [Phycisphaerae bacterium]|nr:hypothetical protein [Phycisphaerae bacterium]